MFTTRGKRGVHIGGRDMFTTGEEMRSQREKRCVHNGEKRHVHSGRKRCVHNGRRYMFTAGEAICSQRGKGCVHNRGRDAITTGEEICSQQGNRYVHNRGRDVFTRGGHNGGGGGGHNWGRGMFTTGKGERDIFTTGEEMCSQRGRDVFTTEKTCSEQGEAIYSQRRRHVFTTGGKRYVHNRGRSVFTMSGKMCPQRWDRYVHKWGEVCCSQPRVCGCIHRVWRRRIQNGADMCSWGGGGGQVPACLHSCVEGEGRRGQGVAEILELAKDPFDVGHDFQLSPLSLCSCCFPKNYSCL